jgi:predicted nucleic acid-binding protein
MSGNALIDTGALLALLDRSDRWHKICADAFQAVVTFASLQLLHVA